MIHIRTRKTRLFCTLFLAATLLTAPAPGAISGNTAWEVRPTVGTSTSGGGFVQGATGTDMSVFNNKNAAGCSSCQSATENLSTTDGVANGTTTYASATANFTAAIVGNIIYLQGGTGAIAAVRRQVTARADASSITLDAAVAASTGMTMNIGGALDSPATALTANTAGNIIFVKATGALVVTANINFNNSRTPANNAPPNQMIGYHTTRFDCDNIVSPCAERPTIRASGNNLTILNGNGVDGWFVRNFIIDCDLQTTSRGIYAYVWWSVSNNKVMDCTNHGIYAAQNDRARIFFNEVTGGTTNGAGIDVGGGTNVAYGNYVHDNATHGIICTDNGKVLYNIVDTTTGATNDGINVGGLNCVVIGNTVYNSGRDGISYNNTLLASALVFNNILSSNGRYGLTDSGAADGTAAFPIYDGNAYYNNATANRFRLDDTGSGNAINALHYTNTRDVILSADPFVNAAAGDFRLNSTAGGGAALKRVAMPGTIPGSTGTGYADFGALQSQPAAGDAAYQ